MVKEKKMELEDWIREAESIDSDPQLMREEKDAKLASLLTDMEGTYQIPILRSEKWEQAHPGVLTVYRQIGDMRDL